jgi:ribonuclease HII
MVDFEIEDQYENKIVAGVDEAGRGSLAGPVVAAAVIVDRLKNIDNIRDSKKIPKKERQSLYNLIINNYCYGVGIVSAAEIDKINILEATKKACLKAVEALKIDPEIVIVDGNMDFSDQRFRSIIKGDDKSFSIAAASIVAKVTRDNIMQFLALDHPLYDWQKNCGYGTNYHLNAICKHGITAQHRKSFAPMKHNKFNQGVFSVK